MSNQFKPHPYQQECINAIIERPGVALWLEMGLGKTVVTLTAIAALLQLSDVSKVLIIAPKKVAEATWQHGGKEVGAPAGAAHEHCSGHSKAARAGP